MSPLICMNFEPGSFIFDILESLEVVDMFFVRQTENFAEKSKEEKKKKKKKKKIYKYLTISICPNNKDC